MKVAIPVLVMVLAGWLLPASAQQPQWKLVPNTMSDSRWAPAACVLANGKSAVIVGGYSFALDSCVPSIDIFDEATGRFRRSRARMTYPRDFAQANLLPNGDVLISGGFNDVWASLDTAEVYDPTTDSCRPAAGKMNQHRELFQAVNLRNGQTLLTGGLDLWVRHTVATAEIYDPATDRFTPTKSTMAQDRFGHAACVLADGRVLIVGGTHWSLSRKESKVLASAEIYDPSTGLFHTTAGSLDSGRDRPTATLLPSGQVLIYGGQGPKGTAVTSAELFDPSTEMFTPIVSPPQGPRMAHCALLLPTVGKVLIAGGWDTADSKSPATALVYDPSSNQFQNMPDLPFATLDAAMLAFPDGTVLYAGGKTAFKQKSGSSSQGAVIAMIAH